MTKIAEIWSVVTRWFATLATPWRQIVVVATVAIMVFVSIFAVTEGISIFKGKPTPYTSSATSSTTLNQGKPDNAVPVPVPTLPGTGSKHPVTAPTALDYHPTMKPLIVPLTPGKAVHAISSDGTMGISLPATALSSNTKESAISTDNVTTLADSVTAAPTQLVLTQIAPPSGSTTSGSVMSFGTYLLQMQDSAGHEVMTPALSQPVLVSYHLPARLAVQPQRIFTLLNGGALPGNIRQQVHLGAQQELQGAYDATASTITVAVPLGGGSAAPKLAASGTGTTAPLAAAKPLTNGSGSTTMSWLTDAPEAYFGQADTFHADLQSGGLSTEIPLAVPAGPGGLTPPIHLSYSSASVNSSHGLQAAAGWVGVGWSLDLGQITWSGMNSACVTCANDFESSLEPERPLWDGRQPDPAQHRCPVLFQQLRHRATHDANGVAHG